MAKQAAMRTAEEIRGLLPGTWRLVRWQMRNPDGTVSYPLGEGALGQLMYDAGGRMSAQLMRRHQSHFASDNWREATRDEKAAAWGEYFGYFGT
jgi:hypothetical protein